MEDETFWQKFCYYLGIDYNYFNRFFRDWFTVRGIVIKMGDFCPPTERVYLGVVPRNNWIPKVYSVESLSQSSETSMDAVQVDYEGSLSPVSACGDHDEILSSDKYNYDEFVHHTPDIVRTINDKILNRRSSNTSCGSSPTDVGIFSDMSHQCSDEALKKLEDLQVQFSQMQKDIASLVQMHLLDKSINVNPSSAFRPIMTSSPATVKLVDNTAGLAVPPSHLSMSSPPSMLPPPPPSMPPPPPPPSMPTRFFKATKKDMLVSVKKGMPDMSEIIKGISSVKLRPVVRHEPTVSNERLPVPFKFQLRSVSAQETIIADALRERFNTFRMFTEIDSQDDANSSIDWDNLSDIDCNVSQNLVQHRLRKIDRSQLPSIVSRDFNISTDGSEQ